MRVRHAKLVVMASGAVEREMGRAEQMLRSLAGEELNTISVNSLETEDAPFLALVISKLSPIIGNLLERRIIDLLTDEETDHGLRWVRQDPDFPDALLVNADGSTTNTGYEVKAWYALSTELTGRFRESVNLLAPRNVRVVVIAWHMSHVVYGTPQIVDVLTVDALSMAEARDEHYHKPPGYLTVEPEDTTARTRNLQQTNVGGYKIQETKAERIAAAERFVREHADRAARPHTPEGRALTLELMNSFAYRLDTNFAKIDRIDHDEIEAFKSEVLETEFKGRTFRAWTHLLKALSDDGNPGAQAKAAKVIEDIYSSL